MFGICSFDEQESVKASDLLCVDTCFSLTPHNFSLTFFFLYFDHTVDEHTTTLAISFDLFYSLSVILLILTWCTAPGHFSVLFISEVRLAYMPAEKEKIRSEAFVSIL